MVFFTIVFQYFKIKHNFLFLLCAFWYHFGKIAWHFWIKLTACPDNVVWLFLIFKCFCYFWYPFYLYLDDVFCLLKLVKAIILINGETRNISCFGFRCKQFNFTKLFFIRTKYLSFIYFVFQAVETKLHRQPWFSNVDRTTRWLSAVELQYPWLTMRWHTLME